MKKLRNIFIIMAILGMLFLGLAYYRNNQLSEVAVDNHVTQVVFNASCFNLRHCL